MSRFAPLDALLAERMKCDSPPDTAALERWQMERLRATLEHARHSPYHAERLAGIAASSLYSRHDLARLPFMEADILREAPLKLLCVSQDDVARAVTFDTSGSTGPPKRVFCTAEDIENTITFFSHGLLSFMQRGEALLALLPAERPASVGRLLGEAAGRVGVRPLSASPEHGWDSIADMAHREGVRAVVGSPLHVREFALAWHRAGFPSGAISTVLLCWDAAPRALRALLAETLGCEVRHHWGMTETGMGGALSCGEAGMHLRENDLLVEVTDPVSGVPLPDGTWGELVVTTLDRRAMPLIRYRTGDRGRILPGTCPCGSPQRRIDLVPGRLADERLLPDGTPLRLIDLDECLLGLPDVVEYRACLHEDAPAVLAVDVLLRGDIPRLGPTMTAREESVAILTRLLSTASPIARAMRLGTLELRVAARDHLPPETLFAKRRIATRCQASS